MMKIVHIIIKHFECIVIAFHMFSFVLNERVLAPMQAYILLFNVDNDLPIITSWSSDGSAFGSL